MSEMNFEGQDRAVIRQWMLEAQQREADLTAEVDELKRELVAAKADLDKAQKDAKKQSNEVVRIRDSRYFRVGKAFSDTNSVKTFFTLPVRVVRALRSA